RAGPAAGRPLRRTAGPGKGEGQAGRGNAWARLQKGCEGRTARTNPNGWERKGAGPRNATSPPRSGVRRDNWGAIRRDEKGPSGRSAAGCFVRRRGEGGSR